MSPRKASDSPFDINAQTDLLEPSNQPEQFQPPVNLFQQSKSLNNDLEKRETFVGTHQEPESAINFLVIDGPEENSDTLQKIRRHIDHLKKQLAEKRENYVKERINENEVKLVDFAQNLFKLSNERRICELAGGEMKNNLLAKRLKETNDFHRGILSSSEDDNSSLEQRFVYSKTLIGLMIVNSCQRPIEIPRVEKIPKYCTWVFMNRNQSLRVEQTLANRRKIYYDKDGEICILSDAESDSEKVEDEEKKRFAESEDYILRMTVEEFGLSDSVVKLLAECFSCKPDDVQARYEDLMKVGSHIGGGSVGEFVLPLEKDLDTALHSFNNLFCRRCMVEKQAPLSSPDADKKTHCGPNCYLVCSGKDNADCDGSWKPLEKSLFETGLQIFGRDSCLIARNVMIGLKTCFETFVYMSKIANEQEGDGGNVDVCDRDKGSCSRKGKARRLKSKPKSSGYPVFRHRIGTIDRLNPHYTPCVCKSSCGKDCGCAGKLTTCEKYCLCPKDCKNRFRGCQCAKSQCQSRQCPCFAAERECDPDVCKNCWISCGDGTLEAPPQKDVNYECKNMKLLLRQQKKIVLGKSDIKGWGAFLTCDVGKEEFLGEYTGEVITHDEAEKRGKFYDRIDLSYLFDLDDQMVLDSFGMGDKLKFANHSLKPNCYAKLVMVGGDYRVAIYSKEAIKAGEEIFYDYQYQPGVSPVWALDSSSSPDSNEVAARKRAK